MFEICAKLLETTFKTGIDALPSPGLLVRWANVPFRQPASGEWVMFTVKPGSGRQDSLGTPKLERQLGLAIVQIFTPKNSGDRRARQIADSIASMFRYKTLTDSGSGVNVVIRAPELVPVGERIDSYQTNLNVPFQGERLFS